jgi:Zn-dependent peptidase ImmA (M78 family)/predicted secreted protein
MNFREATLRGTRGASEALSELGLKTKIKNGLQQIDIFDCLKQLDVVTVCRPLDGLLGAYTTHNQTHGVLVSTNRRLPIQRFTAAHELGHFWLKHGTSIDSEESIDKARNSKGNAPLHEVEAEAFASEFILSKALVGYTIRRQNYSKSELKHPDIIYQLSLRLGASYSATRVAMQNHNFISLHESSQAAAVSPKIIKERLLRDLGLRASHPDVFHLTENDNGSYILSGPEDTVIIELQEHSTSGYSWTDIPSSATLNTLFDFNKTEVSSGVGGLSHRKLVLQGTEVAQISTHEKRAWEVNGNPINTFEITLDFRGQESGLPRAYNQ